MELRDFQVKAVEGLRDCLRAGHKRTMLQAPTGSGKTVIASEIIRSANDKQKHVLFIAHRRELIYQASKKLWEFDIPHGILMAGELGLGRFVQVASIQTLWARRDQGMPPCDLLVIDEAHRSTSKTYMNVIDAYPDAAVIGLSATPRRADGRGLGNIFSAMVQCPGIRELVEMGYLVPQRYFAPTAPDLSGVKVSAGDYVLAQLEGVMDTGQLVGDVVEHWGRIAEGRKTVVFASGVAHSKHLAKEFCHAGVRFVHIDGNTPKDERDAHLRDLSRGDIDGVCNCDVLVEGWDQPDVSCGVIARPTKSPTRFIQMCGRILRPSPGKEDAIIIDHAGAVYQHGFIDEFKDWSLEQDAQQQSAVQLEREKVSATPIVCSNCYCTYVGKPACPECGHQHETRGRNIEFIDEQLGEVTRKSRAAEVHEYSTVDKIRWFCMLSGYAYEHGYKPGWIWHKFQEKFGAKPPVTWLCGGPGEGETGFERRPPDTEVQGWITSRNIRYAKSKKAA